MKPPRAIPLTLLATASLCLFACGDSTNGGTGPGGTGPGGTRDLAVSVHDLAVAASPDLRSPVDAAEPADLAPGADLAPAPDLAADCGTCPPNYVCGTANGLPVCRAPSGIPLFQHVFVIVMENTSWSTLDGSMNTPYLHDLKSKWAYGTDYHGVAHPSLPNYLALASGSTQNVGCDCNPTGGACNFLNCNALVSSCGCPSGGTSIADDLDAASLTWRAYGEDMGSACNTTSSGGYATRHVPFLYFSNIQGNAKRCTDHVVDYKANFRNDLGGAPRAFSFIAPNLTNDMHDPFPAGAQNLQNGDAWLKSEAAAIVVSKAFTAGGLLVIVWDEDDLSGLLAKDDAVPIFVLSPYARSGGYGSATHADHYALLATFEDGLGLPRLGGAVGATPLSDYFPDK